MNPAKLLASGIAETSPLLWGGTVLAARAARRVAESVRRSTGRAALAADAEHLLPVLAAAPRADVFADPFADEVAEPRPSLVILDDGSPDPVVAETRGRLQAQADATGVRVETVTSEADGDVARYAALLATGTFAARYLELGLGARWDSVRRLATRRRSDGTRCITATATAPTTRPTTAEAERVGQPARAPRRRACHAVLDAACCEVVHQRRRAQCQPRSSSPTRRMCPPTQSIAAMPTVEITRQQHSASPRPGRGRPPGSRPDRAAGQVQADVVHLHDQRDHAVDQGGDARRPRPPG